MIFAWSHTWNGENLCRTETCNYVILQSCACSKLNQPDLTCVTKFSFFLLFFPFNTGGLITSNLSVIHWLVETEVRAHFSGNRHNVFAVTSEWAWAIVHLPISTWFVSALFVEFSLYTFFSFLITLLLLRFICLCIFLRFFERPGTN